MSDIEKHLQNRAEDLVDWLFNSEIINTDFSRDDLKGLEAYLAWEFQTIKDSTKRGIELTNKLKAILDKTTA